MINENIKSESNDNKNNTINIIKYKIVLYYYYI